MSTIPTASAGNVVLNGYIDVPADRIEAVSAALVQHIALTRAEAGCRYFDVTPDPSIEGRYNVYEIFTERATFDFHQKRTGESPWAKVSAGIERHFVVTDVSS